MKLFRRKASANPSAPDVAPEGAKKSGWLKIMIALNVVLVTVAVLAIAGGVILHESDTNPQFCATCHLMQKNVNSYMTSNNLDHLHQLAGVQCKDCHNYPIPAEIASGINFVRGNYTTADDGSLKKRHFDDTLCTKCHISLEHVAISTSLLEYNPHDAPGMGTYECNDCHKSHAPPVDTCSDCHDHGDQMLITVASALGLPEPTEEATVSPDDGSSEGTSTSPGS